MPLYEYECETCHHRFEAIRKFSDPPLEVCPKCGGPVRKLMSAPAFHLKGSGWYITDYAKKDAGSGKTEGGSKDGDAKSSEGKTTDAGGAKAESHSDSKADAKTEAKTETKTDSKAEKASPAPTTPKT